MNGTQYWAIARMAGKRNPEASWAALRDILDLRTGSQLDCKALDLLTDRAVAYQKKAARPGHPN
jgi:hypothetical protein